MKKTCAIYTRKSTDERLDMEFNTLDAQREACEAYITSQKSEGWKASPEQYDDGGFSGGSLERPALNRLLDDIKAGKVNVIVVYKIDRLTRALADFSKLVEVFDEYGVTFVSITQSFNTTTSMGRLTLNVLLSFAQFEREVSGERIRDKIAASKAKGMWQGGRAPLGFDIENRRLITNEEDAPKAKMVFELYLKLGCVNKLRIELERRDIKSRRRVSQRGLEYGGEYFSRGALYSLLQNPVYLGKISHKGTTHEGLHNAIIPSELWDDVQKQLQEQAPYERGLKRQAHKNLLTGLIFDEYGNPYTPVFTNKKNKKYRYYFNQALAEDKSHPDKARSRLPAHEIETLIEKAMRSEIQKLSGEENSETLEHLLKHQEAMPTYDLIRTCVEHITVRFDCLTIKFKPDDFVKLVEKHLRVSVTGCVDGFEITVPYQTKRGRDGALVIRSKDRDVFDLQPEDLKRLVQGHIWRNEHFNGTLMIDIAKREGCSDTHVRKAIMSSFDALNAA
jgi:DNA invertase Pin-like site-specific DNA recombinase